MEKQKRRCKNCYFCGKSAVTNEDGSMENKHICRKNPPLMANRMDQWGDEKVVFPVSCWPVIDPEKDWCGEFILPEIVEYRY